MTAIGYGRVSVSLPPTNGVMWVEVGPWQSEAHISSPLLACLVSALLHTEGANGRNRMPSAVRLATAAHGCAWGPAKAYTSLWEGAEADQAGRSLHHWRFFLQWRWKRASSWSLRFRKRISRRQSDTGPDECSYTREELSTPSLCSVIPGKAGGSVRHGWDPVNMKED